MVPVSSNKSKNEMILEWPGSHFLAIRTAGIGAILGQPKAL